MCVNPLRCFESLLGAKSIHKRRATVVAHGQERRIRRNANRAQRNLQGESAQAAGPPVGQMRERERVAMDKRRTLPSGTTSMLH